MQTLLSVPRSRPRAASTAALVAACAFVAFAPALSAQRAAAPETFTIRLHRPHAVGARSHIEREGEKHIRLERKNGNAWEAVRTEDVFVTLHAEETVLAVNTVGKITSADYTVERLEVRRGDQRSTPLARGALVHMERNAADASTRFMSGGQPVAPELADALSVVLSAHASDVTDDQVFGSATPRRVGEQWPMADAVAEQDLARSAHINADLSGNTRLVETTRVAGTPCLVLEGTMTGRLSGLPNLPPTASFDSGSLEATQRGAFPSDGTSHPPTSSFTMSLDAAFSVAVPSQPTQRFRMQVRESKREVTRTLP